MERHAESATRRHREGEVRSPALWFALCGGVAGWVGHLAVSYAVVPFACGAGLEWILHLLTLGSALLAGGATWVGGRTFAAASATARAGPSGELREEGAPVVRFLALSGILLSGFFFVLVLVEGLPALLAGDACGYVPAREGPIIRLLPGGDPGLLARGTGVPAGPGGLALAWVVPGGLGSAWSADPLVLAALYLAGAVYLKGFVRLRRRAGRARGIPGARAASYLGGLAAIGVALLSPIHALGETLFSAHMVQHLLLMVVAPPLLVLGRPLPAWSWALPPPARRRIAPLRRAAADLGPAGRALLHPATILALHVGLLWLWHVPALYELALVHRPVHHLEHASFLGSALLFWWTVARAGRRGRWPGYGAGILYLFATALQGGALGALLLFAPRPWYPAHRPGAAAWGVDPLADQQLAGALMWVPAGLVYAAAAVVLFVAWLEKARAAVRRRERWGWSAPGRGRPGGGALLLAGLLLAAPLLLPGCEMGGAAPDPRQVGGGEAEAGREQLARYGCGACHVIPGVEGANGRVAPPLDAFADRGFVAGVLPNDAEELVRWIVDPPAVNPRTAMPALGVSEAEARHMAAYLYTLR